MKKFTFILTSMLFLLVGGVFSQSVTTLYLNAGANWEATDGTHNWRDYNHDVTYTSGNVKLNGHGWNPGSCGLTGTNWIATVNANEIHTFTVTLSEAPGTDHFVLAGGDPTQGEFDRADEPGHYKVIKRIAADATSASIELTKTYNKVYILNTVASNEILKIASITRTITTASSVALDEESDNSISSEINNVVVELTRSFVKDTWNTVCLPFVPTADQANTLFGSDYKLAEFTGVSGTTMQFTTIAIGSFVAGKPYLVLPKEGCATGTTVLSDVNITAKNPTPVTIGDYTFRGTFTTKKFSGDECNTSRFVATGNELKKPNNNTTLKSLRCYFTVPAAATARSLSFDIDEEGGTTSINTVQGSGVMVNGYYNLAGQRVAQPTKGLYIVNGKKVVIK